jgi:hypothetical protein
MEKISLREAYIIETLRTNGISNEEIINKVKNKDVSSWEKFEPEFDFYDLVRMDEEDAEKLEHVLTNGYQVKFVTFKGLRNLIKLHFDKKEEKDFQVIEKGIAGLVLDREQLERLKQMLSMNWHVTEKQHGDEYEVKIELA